MINQVLEQRDVLHCMVSAWLEKLRARRREDISHYVCFLEQPGSGCPSPSDGSREQIYCFPLLWCAAFACGLSNCFYLDQQGVFSILFSPRAAEDGGDGAALVGPGVSSPQSGAAAWEKFAFSFMLGL